MIDWMEPGGERKKFTITRNRHVSVRFEPFALVGLTKRSQYDHLEVTVDPNTGVPLRTVAQWGGTRPIWERTISDFGRVSLDQFEKYLGVPKGRQVKEVEAKQNSLGTADDVSAKPFQDPLGGTSSARPR